MLVHMPPPEPLRALAIYVGRLAIYVGRYAGRQRPRPRAVRAHPARSLRPSASCVEVCISVPMCRVTVGVCGRFPKVSSSHPEFLLGNRP